MRNNTVIVLGGGWSLSRLPVKAFQDLTKRGFVIGVNDAAIHCRVDAAVTMDRLWLENRVDTLNFNKVKTWWREGICKNVEPPNSGQSFQCNNAMDFGMTLNPEKLNGDNSGACAINLAYQKSGGRDRVYLLGFDMMNGPNGEKHWYPDYAWTKGNGTSDKKFRIWKEEFGPWAKQFNACQIEVANVSSRTALDVWPVIDFEQFLKETS